MEEGLNAKETKRYQLIQALMLGEISLREVQQRLGLSQQRVQYLLWCFITQGPAGFRHGNAGRQPATTIPPEVRHHIARLYQQEDREQPLTAFHASLLAQGFSLSYASLRNILREYHLLPKNHQRKRQEA